MQTQRIMRDTVKKLVGKTARLAVVITAAAVLATYPLSGAAAKPAAYPGAAKTLTYYAFDINSSPADPGFIPVAGTSPKAFAQGDELIINDQLTTPHLVNGATRSWAATRACAL